MGDETKWQAFYVRNQNEAEVDTEGVDPLTLPLPRLLSSRFGGTGATNNTP